MGDQGSTDFVVQEMVSEAMIQLILKCVFAAVIYLEAQTHSAFQYVFLIFPH